jgi:hypothetical protein
MQHSDVYYQLLSQHVSGIIMPIFRRSKTVCYCTRCTALVLLDVAGSGCGALSCRMWAVLASYNSGTVVKVLCYKSEGRWFDPSWYPAGINGFFIDTKSFRSHYGHGVDSPSNRSEYREYFLGVKSGQCIRLTTYRHPVSLSRNLGALTSWNPLGLSRPVMGLLYLLAFPEVGAVASKGTRAQGSKSKTNGLN